MNPEKLNYRELFEAAPGLYLVLDTELKIVAVTDAYLRATMTTRKDILGRGVFEAFPDNPDDRNADGVSNLRASLHRVLEKKVTDTMAIQKYDIRKPAEEGGAFEVRYWSPFNVPVKDSDGNVKYIIHRVEDVTEFILLQEKDTAQKEINERLKVLNDKMALELIQRGKEIMEANKALEAANADLRIRTNELKRSNEELSRFAATASHDIKAPFRTVGAYLDIIRQKLGDGVTDKDIMHAFGRITAARSRISSLLDDLIEFSKYTVSHVAPVAVPLDKVLSDVLKNLEQSIRESGAEVLVPQNLPVVKGHQSQLVRLFQNIISNAIKFQPEGSKPRIAISFREQGKMGEFVIRDNGIGIDPKYFNRIFSVFERLNRQDEYDGSGLGLSISKSIVENHGGKIWLESEPGKGTTFYFTLPLKAS
jgi:signal transduction histidine kinase